MTTRTAVSRRAGAVVGPVLATTALLLAAACGADDPPRVTAATRPVPTAPPAVPTTTAAPVAPAGPTVQEIADALDDISPVRHPRDNTGSCAVKAGCLGLMTTGAVSIYQWPDVTSATRYLGDGGNADRIGTYVLSYRTREQRSTPAQVRRAYADKVRELVGPVP